MNHPSAAEGGHPGKQHGGPHYLHLAIMAGGSFLAMFVLMYAMVNAWPNVLVNLNQAYMAGLMTAPMVLIELLVMRSMYRDRRRNMAIAAGSLVLLVACWLAIRSQAAIGDREFLRSMIPHHAGALLMCRQASLSDAEIRTLCAGIERSQQAEIDQMKAILQRLGSE